MSEECCAAMKMALEFSQKQGMKMRSNRRAEQAGFTQAYLFSKQGVNTENPIVYFIPALGRGKERSKAVNVVVNFCPFCGCKLRGVQSTEVTEAVVAEESNSGPKMGVVSSEAILSSPGLRLDARYHLDAGPKPTAVRNGRCSRS